MCGRWIVQETPSERTSGKATASPFDSAKAQHASPQQTHQAPLHPSAANSPAPSAALSLSAGKPSTGKHSRLRLQRPPTQPTALPVPLQTNTVSTPQQTGSSNAESTAVVHEPTDRIPDEQLAPISSQLNPANHPQVVDPQDPVVPGTEAIDLLSPEPSHTAAANQSKAAHMHRRPAAAEAGDCRPGCTSAGNRQQPSAVAAALRRSFSADGHGPTASAVS